MWKEIFKKIYENKIEGLGILPHYEEYSILNIANWVIENFEGVPFYKPYPLPFKGKKHVVLFLVDAMSYNTFKLVLKEKKNEFKFLGRNQFFPATSIFPSTTANAITTFMTAKPPAEHGILGYILFLKELGALVNMIEFSPLFGGKGIFEPYLVNDILEVETINEILGKYGVKTFTHTHSDIVRSGLSKIHNKGSNIKGYKSLVEMFGMVYDKLVDFINKDEKSFQFAYYGYVDGIGHKYGAKDYKYKAQIYWFLKMLENEFLERINDKILKDTVIIITADHGMLESPLTKEIRFSNENEISKHLWIPPGGEMRMMYFYTKNKKNFYEFFNSNYKDYGNLIDIEEAEKINLFGAKLNQKYRERVGDYIMISKSNYSFVYKYGGSFVHLKGKHGGLSFHEMIVPVIFFG
ncbi:alkaline phosphatase family protein [Marinitoga aeolica]|uniref:Alkaline phosphatase family protein n=1 Tax=Marinitoga aeolica TaxID=2809031 RepID=A0ABY8PPA9_9BACT|nr:alkaline phosphatase family protein [Marinitoga aeolica]WGS64474.1 alkaline phosphatase family protein [Marinitoga aeolica]